MRYSVLVFMLAIGCVEAASVYASPYESEKEQQQRCCWSRVKGWVSPGLRATIRRTACATIIETALFNPFAFPEYSKFLLYLCSGTGVVLGGVKLPQRFYDTMSSWDVPATVSAVAGACFAATVENVSALEATLFTGSVCGTGVQMYRLWRHCRAKDNAAVADAFVAKADALV